MGPPYFIGVDVGTKSVRAALVCSTGVLCIEISPISILNKKTDFYEQRSEEIWNAVGIVVKKVSSTISNKSEIKGIGFDATCSLVMLDENFNPVSTCADGERDFNVIMWMDHRAKEEVEMVNKKKFRVHDFVGGSISIEMETPKLLWVKRNNPAGWKATKHFFELPDFLTFKATGETSRSLCSLVSKWTYVYDESFQGWNDDFFCSVGLEELSKDGYKKIVSKVLSPGELCGVVTSEAASHLGLAPGTAVAASLLDAHAGALSLISTVAKSPDDFIGRLALICGTSTCHMCVREDPIFVKGVWGPYMGTIFQNLFSAEGGQSATGSLVDHIVLNHPAVKECPNKKNVYGWLEEILHHLQTKENLTNVAYLTRSLHVYPDFHGNRSPLADPNLKGMISGLTLDSGIESLALLYLATIQALAYGTRDIVDQLTSFGYKITTIVMCGGLSISRLFIQAHADALGKPISIPEIKESVLFGAAMLGASASGHFGKVGDLTQVALSMGSGASDFKPNLDTQTYHEKKFKVFKKMQNDSFAIDQIMKG